jgi:RimJ/RimL family protein N-acetyltransferase/ribosomal protein S18 acetylase RimI-like enzyme
LNAITTASVIKQPIMRLGTKTEYFLVPIDALDITDQVIDDITTTCQEPLIYQWIFRNIFPDGYKRDHAAGFINHAKEGWRKKECFIFLALDPSSRVVGCISIKNSDINAGEIGYWISAKHPGLATPGVGMLCNISKSMGFRRLFAQTKTDNERSQRVLEKNGFKVNQDFLRDSSCSSAFSLDLSEAETSTPVVNIRRAKILDAAEIANVHINSWREAYKNILPQDFLDKRPLHFKNRYELWKKVTANESQITFVAESPEHGVVGFINGANARDEEYKDYSEVWCIYLLQQYHGRKIGLRLLKAYFDIAIEKEFTKGYLWVLKDNPTIKFYEKTGARLTNGVKRDEIGGQEVEELCYAWDNIDIAPSLSRVTI